MTVLKNKSYSYPMIYLLLIILFLPLVMYASQLEWPKITRECKPWTRWWWQGNSVNKEGLYANLQAYKKAGLGGLELTPIYGVKGQENHFIDYLSS